MTLKEWFTGPERWCQGVMARDPNGDETHLAGNTCSTCLYGAVCMLYGGLHETFERTLVQIRKIIGSQRISKWNDEPYRTFEDVMAVVNQL